MRGAENPKVVASVCVYITPYFLGRGNQRSFPPGNFGEQMKGRPNPMFISYLTTRTQRCAG